MIVGVFDNLQKWRPGSKLFGFLGWPKGVLDNRQKELTKEIIVRLATGGARLRQGPGAWVWSGALDVAGIAWGMQRWPCVRGEPLV